MKATKKTTAKKTATKPSLDKKKIHKELYKPENIEKARRIERGPIV